MALYPLSAAFCASSFFFSFLSFHAHMPHRPTAAMPRETAGGQKKYQSEEGLITQWKQGGELIAHACSSAHKMCGAVTHPPCQLPPPPRRRWGLMRTGPSWMPPGPRGRCSTPRWW